MSKILFIGLFTASSAFAGNLFINFDAFYGPTKLGFGIFQISQSENDTSLEASFASSGVVNFLKNASGSVIVKIEKINNTKKRSFKSSGIWGNSHSSVKVLWDDASKLPQVEKFRSKPLQYQISAIPDGQLINTIDPLTPILNLMQSVNEKKTCSGRYRIFDGIRRYDIRFENIKENITSSVIRCNISVSKIGGFKKKKNLFFNIESKKTNQFLEFISVDGVFVPSKILLSSPIGSFFIKTNLAFER